MPILITDQTPMLTLMQQNIALNSLTSKVQAAVYDWGSPVPDPAPTSSRAAKLKTPHPDVVLAADCVYFEPAFPLLLQTLNDLIGPETVCYFCFKKRRKADWRFVKHMMKSFDVTPIVDAVPEEDRREGIHLYEVRKRVTSG
jgi:protein N-lysine methyltransferase METTL21A